MRFDTPVFFRSIKPGEYDASTGNYGDDVITEEMRLASVTDSGENTIRLVYGGIKQGSKTIRLQNNYSKPFDSIRIGNTLYNVDFARNLRVRQTFVVSEVQ